jgi:hypothetical protein
VSKAEVALIFEVIPLIDKFTEKFEALIMDGSLHSSIRHAAKIALQVLNKYYSLTDHCDAHRVSICTFPSPFSTFAANPLFDEVLHPQFKTYYFNFHKWPPEWVEEALSLTRNIWLTNYKPKPVSKSRPPPAPVPAPSIAGAHSKKSRVDFTIILDYGPSVKQGPDALEDYLKDMPLPKETDPIGYWLKQRKAGEAMDNPSKMALAQMALDYLSVPGMFFRNFVHS